MNFIHLVIDVIVELLIEFVFNVLWQVVVKILVWERWFWELSEGIEVWSVLEALDVHHIWELKVRLRRGHHICRINLPHVDIPKLVHVIVCYLIHLPDLTLTSNLAILLELGLGHVILVTWARELLGNIVWLLPLCLSMLNNILNVWAQVLRIDTTHGGLLSRIKLLWLVIMLH